MLKLGKKFRVYGADCNYAAIVGVSDFATYWVKKYDDQGTIIIVARLTYNDAVHFFDRAIEVVLFPWELESITCDCSAYDLLHTGHKCRFFK